MELKLKFDNVEGPGLATYYPILDAESAGSVGPCVLVLAEGEHAVDRAMEVAESLCSLVNANRKGEPYSPADSYGSKSEAEGLERAALVPKIMAKWYAYNNEKLTSGAWSIEDFTTFMPLALSVSGILHTYAFGATKAAIMAFDHKLATPEAKADYIKIMEEVERG